MVSEAMHGCLPPLWLRSAYHSVKLAALVALRSSLRVLRLSRAELPKVLRRSRHKVSKELHLDPAQRLACADPERLLAASPGCCCLRTSQCDIEEHDRIGGGAGGGH